MDAHRYPEGGYTPMHAHRHPEGSHTPIHAHRNPEGGHTHLGRDVKGCPDALEHQFLVFNDGGKALGVHSQAWVTVGVRLGLGWRVRVKVGLGSG